MFFKQKIFVASFITLDLVAIFHYIGLRYELYWIYNWYDVPMHILGGLWASLFFLSVYAFFYKNITIVNYRRKILLMILCVVLVASVGWEIFELLGGITVYYGNQYWLSVAKDIISGFGGGLIAFFIYNTYKKSNFDVK